MTTIEENDELWTEAKSTVDVRRLAEIGMVLLDECVIVRGMTSDRDYTLLARVQWITARIEFLRIAQALRLHKEHEGHRVNPYMANMPNKFGPVRHEDINLSGDPYSTPTVVPPTFVPDEKVTDLGGQLRDMMRCVDPGNHAPHPVGDTQWCIGGLADDVKL